MKNDKNFLRIIIAGAGILVVLVIALVAVLIWRSHNRDNDMQQGESLAAFSSEEEGNLMREVLQTSPVEDEESVLTGTSDTPKVSAGNFQVTMTTEWNYPDISTPAEDSYVENALGNTLDTKFSVVLKADENVVIYESPLLPVGSYTAGIPIKTELSPGKYDCVVIYDLFSPETGDPAGTVRVGLVINIGA